MTQLPQMQNILKLMSCNLSSHCEDKPNTLQQEQCTCTQRMTRHDNLTDPEFVQIRKFGTST
jgi:hypothetical protein